MVEIAPEDGGGCISRGASGTLGRGSWRRARRRVFRIYRIATILYVTVRYTVGQGRVRRSRRVLVGQYTEYGILRSFIPVSMHYWQRFL